MARRRERDFPAARLLEQLPGIDDVVWSLLARLDAASERQRFVFLAPESRAGTTVIAAATAIGLLQHRRARVCLVEANVQEPALAQYLGLRPTGLTDLLAGQASLLDCLQQPRGCTGLRVLPAGTARPPIPGEFTTDAFRAILDEVAAQADYLLIDAPPLLEHIESRQLVRESDGALLVLCTGRTRKTDVERCRAILAESGAPVMGAIFNAWRPAGPFGRPAFDPKPPERALVSPDFAWAGTAEEPELATAIASAELATAGTNGHAGQAAAGPVPPGSVPEQVHRAKVELLERRIAKLTTLLEQAEQNLARLAAMRGDDPGLASIYRTVQGLSPDERAFAFKQKLMQKIFQANLEIKQELARHQ